MRNNFLCATLLLGLFAASFTIHGETIAGNYQRTNVVTIPQGEAIVIDTAIAPIDSRDPRTWWESTNGRPVRIGLDREHEASNNYRYLSQDPPILAGPGRLFVSAPHAITFHRVKTTNLVTVVLRSNDPDPTWISINDTQRIVFLSALAQASYWAAWDVAFLPPGTKLQWDRLPFLEKQELMKTKVSVDFGARARVFDGPYELLLADSTFNVTTSMVLTYALIDNPRFEEPFPVADLQQNSRSIIVERSEDLQHWGTHSVIRSGSDPRQTFRLRIAN